MNAQPYVIGLTGNIATGKSVVAGMLAELGAQIVDADEIAHDVIKPGTTAWQRVVERCGPDILNPDGEIDRARLGAQVFADPQAMACLEEIVHPEVIERCQRLLEESKNQAPDAACPPTAARVVVLEAIKLLESGMRHRCNEVWVVTSTREQQLHRLTALRGLSVAEAELRINAQPSQAEKVAAADVVIDNSSTLEQTQAQVEREWRRIVQAQDTPSRDKSGGGVEMPSWRRFIEEHPYLTMWAVLAVGMVAIFLVTSRDVDLLPSQRLFMAAACVGLAGLCSWIISWE